MDLLLEFLIEGFFQFLVEVFGEGFGRLLDTRLGRLVFSAAVGFAGGFAWGRYVDGTGAATPKTLWTSLAFAVAGVFVSVRKRESIPAHSRPARGGVLPWRWSAGQWESFALLNVFVALGITAGFYGF